MGQKVCESSKLCWERHWFSYFITQLRGWARNHRKTLIQSWWTWMSIERRWRTLFYVTKQHKYSFSSNSSLYWDFLNLKTLSLDYHHPFGVGWSDSSGPYSKVSNLIHFDRGSSEWLEIDFRVTSKPKDTLSNLNHWLCRCKLKVACSELEIEWEMTSKFKSPIVWYSNLQTGDPEEE